MDTNKPKSFTARLLISKRESNTSEKAIAITVEDDASSTRVLELTVPLADFAEALTGRYLSNVAGRIWPAPVGAVLEVKQEVVPFKDRDVPYTKDRAARDAHPAVAAALAPFEVDGWRAHRDDLFNGHRSVSPDSQRVTFRRHVDPETGKPI